MTKRKPPWNPATATDSSVKPSAGRLKAAFLHHKQCGFQGEKQWKNAFQRRGFDQQLGQLGWLFPLYGKIKQCSPNQPTRIGMERIKPRIFQHTLGFDQPTHDPQSRLGNQMGFFPQLSMVFPIPSGLRIYGPKADEQNPDFTVFAAQKAVLFWDVNHHVLQPASPVLSKIGSSFLQHCRLWGTFRIFGAVQLEVTQRLPFLQKTCRRSAWQKQKRGYF